MNRKLSVQKLCASALLIAVGTIIPMISPLKLIIPPASFTLASHVAIFIAMMISPAVAVSVALGTTAGFFLAGAFPIVVVLRAASHLVFVIIGSFYIHKRPFMVNSFKESRLFSLFIGLIHAACEVLVVTAFYLGDQMGSAYYESGFFQSVIILVGFGTVVHSMVDFEISIAIVKVLQKQKGFSALINS